MMTAKRCGRSDLPLKGGDGADVAGRPLAKSSGDHTQAVLEGEGGVEIPGEVMSLARRSGI